MVGSVYNTDRVWMDGWIPDIFLLLFRPCVFIFSFETLY